MVVSFFAFGSLFAAADFYGTRPIPYPGKVIYFIEVFFCYILRLPLLFFLDDWLGLYVMPINSIIAAALILWLIFYIRKNKSKIRSS
jgi:hypothetical protein